MSCERPVECYDVGMSQKQIKHLIENRVSVDGMFETGISEMQLFRVTDPVRCAPAVYEPSIIAIVNGVKEAILDGERYVYDSSQYMCCSMSMPVEAGTPMASKDNPLLGVYISLNTRVMTDLAISMERAGGVIRKPNAGPLPQGITLAPWDACFSEALLRLLQLLESPADVAVLGEGRLRELYYAILTGGAAHSARRAFGVGNEIARSIEYLSSNLEKAVTIEDLAARVGMSRAVFHRKFKQATTLSPIQFVKYMRLNTAAMNIANGMTVNEAAMGVGYLSSSQFSREFKRLYGQSPKHWIHSNQLPSRLM